MAEISRRRFVEAGALAAAAAGAIGAVNGEPAPVAAARVDMTGDGAEMSPAEYASLLARLLAEGRFEPDAYGLGGAADDLEKHFASLLGKERALFFPTGTMANHVAIRTLAGARRRVIVQDVSHVYNDTGDSAQSLSGLNLVPLAPGRATFSWDDVQKLLDRTASGRVRSDVGVVSIESPVRRLRGEMFDLDAMKAVSREARSRGIRLHLDGARLFIASAYTGMAPAEYAALFDTVYVSLWKYFGAPNGAILAGPADVMEGLFHVRRAFGGALWAVWPFAVVARHLSDGFVERMKRGIDVSRQVLARLGSGDRFAIEPIPNGTNVVGLRLRQGDPKTFKESLRERGIDLPPPAPDGSFILRVNETWARRTAGAIVGAFS
ncbi:MAG TPA: beta-eliminating lyase-related protein [Vicinamibacteria bacterium]|nr:beta-eliminating lyase-related protein [Vicinamibacteria bacterium]